MTTFITGGASQIGLALARLLSQANRPVLFGSRAGRGIPEGLPWVRFDWDDPSTYENAFKHPSEEKIKTVYILPPVEMDPVPQVSPFVKLSIQNGVKRFILISASDCEKGGMQMGAVHEYLEKICLEKKGLVDFVALRPTWFTDNLAREQYTHIRENNEIVSPLPTARIPFVAVEDIAQAAFDGIVYDGFIEPEDEARSAPYLVGPDLLSYDEIAQILSDSLGRPIKHRIISPDVALAQYIGFGIPEESSKWLVEAELALEKGSAERLVTKEEFSIFSKVGRVSVKQWVEENKGVWSKQI